MHCVPITSHSYVEGGKSRLSSISLPAAWVRGVLCSRALSAGLSNHPAMPPRV